MDIILIDNTKRQATKQCMRKYFWRFERHLDHEAGSMDLIGGATYHGVLEGYYRHIQKFGWKDKHNAIPAGIEHGKKIWDIETAKYKPNYDFRSFNTYATALVHYIANFSQDEEHLDIIETELPFKIELELTSDEKQRYPGLPPVIFFGKIDLTAKLFGVSYIFEWKTTKEPIQTNAARLYRSAQIIGYNYATKFVVPTPVEACLVGIARIAATKSKKTGEYGETSYDFLRSPQMYNTKDFEDWRDQMLFAAYKIYLCNKADNWPCEFDSCFDYGKNCSFQNLCKQNKDIWHVNTDGYISNKWLPQEKGES